MSNPAPGFSKYPDHRVSIEPQDTRVRVRVGDTVIVDTQAPLLVRESRHDDVWYLPKADVDFSLLRATATSTYCPFKGHASYWSVQAGTETLEDCVWAYEDPFDECAPLKDHVAVYQDRVRVEVGQDP